MLRSIPSLSQHNWEGNETGGYQHSSRPSPSCATMDTSKTHHKRPLPMTQMQFVALGEGPGVRVSAQHLASPSHRLINQMRRHKFLVQRDPQSRPVGDFDAAIGRLNSFVRQFMPHRDILDAIFE